jgi:hypothetical protein
VYAEVRRGDAVLMISSADAAYETPPLIGQSVGSGVYLCPLFLSTTRHTVPCIR